ncbi:type I-F CRISPR-associated endonuclease Cas1f, partial [Escherichia albertii]|uniref:type I-F CRISPR-associated endonuclease Cas1f n=1 Tax=Escherichia albertii TaxID=208962 RepID=UPI000F0B895F
MSSNYLTPSDLKTILHSKRANIYYLEKCRVQVNGGRVEYVTSEGKESYYWNIPIANTTALMLGMGTSVTQAAMREFAHAGVMVGFCGTDGTPLYSANEVDVDVSWLSPQSEYRPTEYLQQWVSFWFVEDKRLAAAKLTRAKRGGGIDMANRFLDQGNYLAYGLAAVAAWVTGIPHGLAVMHGKTRRGGLVFDLADLIKDA